MKPENMAFETSYDSSDEDNCNFCLIIILLILISSFVYKNLHGDETHTAENEQYDKKHNNKKQNSCDLPSSSATSGQ